MSKFFSKKLQELNEEAQVAQEMAARGMTALSARRGSKQTAFDSSWMGTPGPSTPLLSDAKDVGDSFLLSTPAIPVPDIARRFTSGPSDFQVMKGLAGSYNARSVSSNVEISMADLTRGGVVVTSSYADTPTSTPPPPPVMTTVTTDVTPIRPAINVTTSSGDAPVIPSMDTRNEEGFKRMITETYRHATLLQNFQMMNHTGFVKLFKAFRKHGFDDRVHLRVSDCYSADVR